MCWGREYRDGLRGGRRGWASPSAPHGCPLPPQMRVDARECHRDLAPPTNPARSSVAESHLTQTLRGQILARIERLACHPT
jgi:hypothetical protein